jgi:hypothetical protein
LMVEALHLSEDLFAPLIGGHVAEVTEIEPESAEEPHELGTKFRRVNKGTLLRWRVHSRDLEAV